MSQNLILYLGGCYGTFFEWIFNFLEGTTTLAFPFASTGSSHNFTGNFLFPADIFNHIKSKNNYRFSRCHPNIFEKVNEHENSFRDHYDNVVQSDLNFLKKHFDKILVLTYNEQSILWSDNNTLDKIFIQEEQYQFFFAKYGYSKEYFKDFMTNDPIQRLRHILDKNINSKLSSFTTKNLLGWNKTSIYDFDIWELRELLSLYYFSKHFGQIHAWKSAVSNNPDIKFIFIDSLQNDFINTVTSAANYFDIHVNDSQLDKLTKIHEKWKELQHQMNKDALCKQIVKSIIDDESFDWSDYSLSIIDEAWIQKSLADNGLQIKCYNLNIFPTNSKNFQNLLEVA